MRRSKTGDDPWRLMVFYSWVVDKVYMIKCSWWKHHLQVDNFTTRSQHRVFTGMHSPKAIAFVHDVSLISVHDPLQCLSRSYFTKQSFSLIKRDILSCLIHTPNKHTNNPHSCFLLKLYCTASLHIKEAAEQFVQQPSSAKDFFFKC